MPLLLDGAPNTSRVGYAIVLVSMEEDPAGDCRYRSYEI